MKKRSFFAALLTTATALLAVTLPTFAYSDVDENTAITWITDQGVMQGYNDGSFQPDREITRAEFLKTILALQVNQAPDAPSTPCFNDVASTAWYAPYVCAGKEDGLTKGYTDGSFKPDQPINVVEASKLITAALTLAPTAATQGTEWYSASLETLGDLNAYPDTLHYLNENLTRGEVAEILWRLHTSRTDQAHTSWQDFSPTCSDFSYDIPSTIDVHTIENTWLGWMNATRAAQGLPAYTLNDQLKRSSTAWSQYSKGLGSMSHKRPGTTAYYDYYAIQDWFANLGLTFENDSGTTFTENIGHGPYSCNEADCTQDLIDAIRYTYDYFLSEAGKSYAPHWNSIVNSHFKEVGIGITVDSGSYYLTIHYATSITSDPAPLCD